MSFKHILAIAFILTCSIGFAQPDINLDWATYYGGSDDDFGFSTTVDKNGNTCVVGQTASSNNISTPSSFLSSLNGTGSFIVYFDKNGVRKWGTYYKGNIYDVQFDSTGNVYITGYTNDTAAATTNIHQDSLWGASDAFLTKFSATGNRIWSTYFGGSMHEIGYDIEITRNNDVILAGFTTSSNNIATSNVHQGTYNGSADLFLAKFNSSGNILWSTYYGGPGKEYDVNVLYKQCGIAIDNRENIFLTGTTTSTTQIATPAAFLSTRNYTGITVSKQLALSANELNKDAFLVKFDKQGVRQWATYFGDSSNDIAQSIACDLDGNVYISGFTDSKNGIATSNANQQSFNVVSSYLAKFSGGGQLDWATYQGDSLNDFYHNPPAIHFDENRNIYMNTFKNQNLSTANSPQPSPSGEAIAVVGYNTDGNRIWGTYLGGNKYNTLTDIHVSNNRIVATGITTSDSFLATSNAHQDTYGGNRAPGGIPPILILPAGDAFTYAYEHQDTNVYISPTFADSVLCSSSFSLTVPCKVTRNFNVNNTFTVQLSDTTGSFSTLLNIGSINATGAANIFCSLPTNIRPSKEYRIRIVASSPVDTSITRNLNIHSSVLPTLTLHANPNDTLCSVDTNASIIAVLNNPGIQNFYSWKLNGNNIGISGSTYFTDSLKDNDVIICEVSSNVHCLGAPALIADTITAIVDTPIAPNVTIGISPDDTLCIDTALLYPISVLKGGSNPVFEWYTDLGVSQGAPRDTLIGRNFAVNGGYYCVMKTDATCITRDFDTSNTIMIITTSVTKAHVTIQASPGSTVPVGTNILFTTTFNNSGSAPEYQWTKNGADIPGATNSTYYAVYPSLSTNDVIGVRVRNTTDMCVSPDRDTSNNITVIFTNGISDNQANGNQLSLFPNPNSGNFVLKGSVDNNVSEAKVKVTNTLGQEVYHDVLSVNRGIVNSEINLTATLPSGLYLLQITAGGKSETLRFTLNR